MKQFMMGSEIIVKATLGNCPRTVIFNPYLLDLEHSRNWQKMFLLNDTNRSFALLFVSRVIT
ncbi:MAG: hypothetical protein NT091_03520 [Candidatus Falkowbacteria bacterium]|nr:hypothetical protein [Candidatus Falkowbacteria bacterium]